jgi:hypothetical protein
MNNPSGAIFPHQLMCDASAQPSHCSRVMTAEAYNAIAAQSNPETLLQDTGRGLPSVLALRGGFRVESADHNVLLNAGHARSAAQLVSSFGRNDQDARPFINLTTTTWQCGQTNTVPAPSPVNGSFSHSNLVLGAMIEWGVQSDAFLPFDMHVWTHNFRNFSMNQVPVDRDFTIRFDPTQGNGGMFAFLFALRQPRNGSAYGTVTASGSMNAALVQPAYIGLHYFDANATGVVLQRQVAGFNTQHEAIVAVDIPAALQATFSASCRLLTAGSPALATVCERLGLMDPSRIAQQ